MSTDYKRQVDDLVVWVDTYLAINEPLPTTVRKDKTQHFLHLFANLKRFGLKGTYEITTGTDPLYTTATLLAFIDSEKHELVSFQNQDVNKFGGVVVCFDVANLAVGSFNIFIKTINGTRQVWGRIIASVKTKAGEEKFDEELYLCPVTPPGPNFSA